MFSILAAFLLLAASSLAITVTSPNNGTTWTSSGPNVVTWSEVSTDPTTFAITLVQQGVFKQLLADNVDGTKGSLTITTTGLPVGNTFQVNIVKSSQEVNSLLAQSGQFNITSGGASSSTTTGLTATSGSGSSSGGASTTSGASATSGTPATAPASSSLANTQPSATTSGALSSFQPNFYGGLLSGLTFLVILFI